MIAHADITALLPGGEGDWIVGFADLGGLLHERYAGHPFAIVIGRRLDDAIMDDVADGPVRAYYDHYRDINRRLSDAVRAVADRVRRDGFDCRSVEPTVLDEQVAADYMETMRLDFSHKMAATRAGLGWIGKTDLFVSERFGPRLRLATVLADREVAPVGTPVTESRCGACALCVERCPAKAATGKLWSITVDRDEFYDPWKCREKCRELARTRIGVNESICGICVSVCPVGRAGAGAI